MYPLIYSLSELTPMIYWRSNDIEISSGTYDRYDNIL